MVRSSGSLSGTVGPTRFPSTSGPDRPNVAAERIEDCQKTTMMVKNQGTRDLGTPPPPTNGDNKVWSGADSERYLISFEWATNWKIRGWSPQ